MKNILKVAILFALSVMMAIICAADTEYDGYIIKFKDDKGITVLAEKMEQEASLFSDDGVIDLETVVESDNLYKTHDEKLIEELMEMGLLEYYEPDALCYLMDYDYSKDRYFSEQMDWAHGCSKAPEAWTCGVYGNDVRVAVIDSGVMVEHEELSHAVVEGVSFVDGSPATTAVNSHGTSVAGIIAAAANGKGVVGVAHRAKIVPIKVVDSGSFKVSTICQALDAAMNMDVDVINLSLGLTSQVDSLKEAIDEAISMGIIVVASSGNVSGSVYQGDCVYPAYYPNVISVGNLTRANAGFEIYSGSIANSQVTVCAPGTSVITANSSSASSYGRGVGTSFSCPYVSGIAALAKSIDPNITQDEFMQILIDTADKSVLGGQTRLDTYGYGIADAGAAIREIIRRRNRGGFISPIDRTASGGINVKIYNPTSAVANYTFISKVQSGSKVSDISLTTVPLSPGGVLEVPLLSLQGAATSSVSCFLIDSYNFSPLYEKIYG